MNTTFLEYMKSRLLETKDDIEEMNKLLHPFHDVLAIKIQGSLEGMLWYIKEALEEIEKDKGEKNV